MLPPNKGENKLKNSLSALLLVFLFLLPVSALSKPSAETITIHNIQLKYNVGQGLEKVEAEECVVFLVVAWTSKGEPKDTTILLVNPWGDEHKRNTLLSNLYANQQLSQTQSDQTEKPDSFVQVGVFRVSSDQAEMPGWQLKVVPSMASGAGETQLLPLDFTGKDGRVL